MKDEGHSKAGLTVGATRLVMDQSEATGTRDRARDDWRTGRALLLLLGGFFLLTTYYSFRIPLWEAPDEPMHVAVLRDLAAGRLPPLMTKRVGIGEEHQPPLYYLAAAPAVGIADGTWLSGLTLPFPRGAAAAARAARLMSSLMALVTVACVYYLVAALLGDRRLAILVAVFTALTPGFLMTSATANNDNAAIMFSAATAVYCVRMLRREGRSPGDFLLAGLVAVAAAMSKLTGLFAVALFISSVGITIIQGVRVKRWRGPVLGIGIMIGLLGSSWVLSSQFGTGARMMSIVEGKTTLSPQSWARLWEHVTVQKLASFGWDLTTSYWGTAGWQTYTPLNEGIYWAAAMFGALAALGLIVRLIRAGSWAHWSSETRAAAASLGFSLALLLAVLLVSAVGEGGTLAGRTHARFLFPAVGVVSLVLIGGFLALLPTGWRYGIGWAVLGGLALIHLTATFSGPALYSGPVSGEPRWSSDTSGSSLPVRFVSGVSLVGFAARPSTPRAGDSLSLTLLWRTDVSQGKDFSAFAHLVDFRGQAVAKNDGVPTGHRFPPRLWRSGDLVVEERTLTIPADTPAGAYGLQFGAYVATPTTISALAINGASGQAERPRVDLAEVIIRSRPVSIPGSARAVGAQFADGIVLEGALGGERTGEDRRLALTLYWSAADHPQRDYAVSVQLLGPDGIVLAQDDGPLGGTLRTTLWERNEIVPDSHTLSVPGGARPGTYTVGVAVYDPVSGERLAVAKSGIGTSGNMVQLREAVVE